MQRGEIERTVTKILSDMFDADEGAMHTDTSLIDELDAESIDFVDLVYRLEEAFGIEVPQEDVFRGTLDLKGRGFIVDDRVNEQGMALVRETMPNLDLSRFAGGVIRSQDLPRLVTVGTIAGYLHRRLSDAAKA